MCQLVSKYYMQLHVPSVKILVFFTLFRKLGIFRYNISFSVQASVTVRKSSICFDFIRLFSADVFTVGVFTQFCFQVTVKSPKLEFDNLHATQKKILYELIKQAEYELQDDIIEVRIYSFLQLNVLNYGKTNINFQSQTRTDKLSMRVVKGGILQYNIIKLGVYNLNFG